MIKQKLLKIIISNTISTFAQNNGSSAEH